MKVLGIGVIKNFTSKQVSNPIKNQTVNYEIKDTVSFGKKEKGDDIPVIYGADYSILSDINTKRDRTVPELKKAYKAGEDISEEKNKLILSRVKIAIEDAKKFTEKHPELNTEDVIQELVLCAVSSTNRELESTSEKMTFGPIYAREKKFCFNRLLKENHRTEPLDETMQDTVSLDKVIDDFMLKSDIDKVLKTLSPKQAQILTLHYGLDGEEGRTYRQIGKDFGVYVEAIFQTHNRAIEKINRSSSSAKLRAYNDCD